MSTTRIFCSRKRIEDGVFTVSGDEAHHVLRVMRLKQDDSLNIFTEQGSEFTCTIIAATKSQFKAKIEEKLTDEVESPLILNLVQGMPKATKLEQIIVHGTELGLSNLFPVYTQHSISKSERRERWRKLALEAAKQSRRRVIPQVHQAIKLSDLDLESFRDGLCLVAAEPPWQGSLEAIAKKNPDCKKVTVVVGPEGGFAEFEMERLIENDFLPFSMGNRVLRTQTASLAAFSALQFLFGDWT